jgi:threonine synthase
VPTGNFGNVFSGWIARRMGAPIDDFIVASNANDILTRFVNDGDMSTRDVVPTQLQRLDIDLDQVDVAHGEALYLGVDRRLGD